MKLVYADPPYLGQCQRYGHEHNDGGTRPFDGRCWNDVETHRTLLDYLMAEYDGWSYSCTSASLALWMPYACTGATRIAAWVKPFAAFKANVRIAYTWEPVLFVPGRDRSKDGAPVGRDHLAESIVMRAGFTGTKPERFCRWVLDLMGYVEGDEVDDLFPGAGPMSRALAAGVLV